MNAMDLDAMKEKWAEHDRKLETSLHLNRLLLGAAQLGRARSALQRLVFFLALEAVVGFAAIGALGSFIYEHIAMPRFALPAIAVDAFLIAMFVAIIRQMVAALRVDYGQPVASIQKQLEALRVLRIRTVQWGLLAGTLVWTLFMIVACKALFGLDVYRAFAPAWLLSNLLFALALFPLAIWVSRKYGDRMGRSPFIQRLMRDLAGHNLNAAAGFLASLAAFEDE